MRKLFMWLCGVLLFATAPQLITTLAQPDWGDWEALAYDPNSGIVYSIDDQLSGAQVQLPAPPQDQETIPRHVAVSPDGNRLVYMTYREPVGNGGFVGPDLTPRDGTMMVFNRATGQADPYPFNDILDHNLNYIANNAMFNPAGNEIAVGYVQADGWYIAILDVVNRTYTQNLLVGREQTLTGAASTYQNPLPLVTNYDGTLVEFVVFPAGQPEPPLVLNSYAWDTSTGETTQTVRFTEATDDIFRVTGEVIGSANNPDFPQNPNAFPRQHYNVLEVSTGPQERQPFYTSSQFSLLNPTFVQNGSKVAFGAFDVNGNETWTAISRTGGPGQVFSAPAVANLPVNDIVGLEFGALVATDSQSGGELLGLQQLSGTSLIHVDLRENVTNPYALVTSIEAPFLQLIWAGYQTTALPVNYDFGPWRQPDSGNTINAQVASADTLTEGGQARVFTTEGDPLNVRSAPGTQFGIVARLTSGETVDLLEGPVQAETFTWWRVRTPSGVEGWTVESAENIRTLQVVNNGQPTLPIATPVPDGIYVGGQVVVVLDPGGAANLRAEPTTTAGITRIIRDNPTLNVTGGPVSAEGYTWWQVQTQDTSLTGWLVEAVGTETVLEPTN